MERFTKVLFAQRAPLSPTALVEKKKTGEFCAAKVVSQISFAVMACCCSPRSLSRKKASNTRSTSCSTGKASSSTSYVARVSRLSLAERVSYSQRSVAALCRGRKSRRRQALPRDGHGPARTVPGGPVLDVQAQVRLEDRPAHRHPNGKRLSSSSKISA